MLEHWRDREHSLAAVTIRRYRDSDELEWLRCSVLSFLETSYFDSVLRHKPHYERPAIELVAESEGTIVGVLDVEVEEITGSVCTVCMDDDRARLGGMIWHLAVHPDFQRRGIGQRLLREAQRKAARRGINCFEAWTRDDTGTLRWYESLGFERVKNYLHVHVEGKAEIQGAIQSSIPGLIPQAVFAHYVGADGDSIRSRFDRVHDCNCYRLCF